MAYSLTIDPGLSTGIVLAHYTDTTPWRRVAFWQVEGGIRSFNLWWRTRWVRAYPGSDIKGSWWDFPGVNPVPDSTMELVAEKFTPLHHEGFNLTEDSVEPLRIEGAIITHLGYDPIWQRPQDMYFAGGETKAEKLKLAKQWLRDHGLYLKGSEVGCKDANDVHSATLHSLVRMRNTGHLPTLERWFK